MSAELREEGGREKSERLRFPKRFHLRRSKEFGAVYARRFRIYAGILCVCAAPNQLGHARLGLSVSRKVGGAVVRNRWKRLLRELFRRNRVLRTLPFDFIVIPPRAAVPPRYDALARMFQKLCARLMKQQKGGSQNRF